MNRDSRLTTAAKSSCPEGAEGLDTPPGFGFGAAAGGLEAAGTGGLAPTFGGAPGFAAKGGGPGFGFGAGGGPLDASELTGREFVGVVSLDDPFVPIDAVFFQGAADPFEGTIPGKTATGFADGSAVIGFGNVLAVEAVGVTGVTGAAGAVGGTRRPPGGGGGGAGAALGFGGTSSR